MGGCLADPDTSDCRESNESTIIQSKANMDSDPSHPLMLLGVSSDDTVKDHSSRSEATREDEVRQEMFCFTHAVILSGDETGNSINCSPK
jgi:hypothetical protein